MSTSGATSHNKHLPCVDMDKASVKLRERPCFFEDVVQDDVVACLSASHLHINSKKPPMGSISSMEVNVDILEQMDLMEISDHEALDVFLNSGNDIISCSSTLPAEDEDEDELEDNEDNKVIFRQMRKESRSRNVSTSTVSSQENSNSDGDTPIVQSDEEEVQVDNFLLMPTSMAENEEEEEEKEKTQPRQLS